jgi:hypothetical protein
VRWQDFVVHGDDNDGEGLQFQDLIGMGTADPNAGEDVNRLLEAIKAEIPFLSRNEMAVLNWKLDPRGGKLISHAAKMGISKGYASKLNQRIDDRLAKRFKR